MKAFRLAFALVIAGVLIVVGSVGVWRATSFGNITESRLGIEFWQGNLALVGGIAVLFSAAMALRSIELEWFEARRPLSISSVAGVGGILALLGALAAVGEIAGTTLPGIAVSIGWGIPLTSLASLLAIYISYEFHKAESPAIPRGLSG